MTSLQDDENLKALSNTLYELTKYDNDLRVFFESCTIHQPVIESNLGTSNVPKTTLGSEPNHNENNFQNDIKNDFGMTKVPETTLDPKPDHNENNFRSKTGKMIAMYMAASILNNSQIGNQKLNHSTETKLTAGLIYEFLKLEKNSIQLNISKLSDELQQIVNCLLGIEAPQPDDINELSGLVPNNNNKSNTNSQNQSEQFNQFGLTKKGLSNEPQNSNYQQKSNSNQVNTDKQSTVSLTTDQFKDLIYYLIVLAVAKNKEIDIYATGSNVNYNDVKKEIEEAFKSKNTHGIFTKLEDYRQKVEDQTLRERIFKKLQEQEDQTSFWFPLLLSYLGRASFLYGLYNAIISGDNHKKNVIDVALASPNILFALSLLFGFGAAANLILGFITLVSLLYKFIDQYPKKRKKYLIYKLVRSKLFRSKLGELGNALTPQVGNFYKLRQEIVNENNEIYRKGRKEYFATLDKKYGKVQLSTQKGNENIDLNNLQNPYENIEI